MWAFALMAMFLAAACEDELASPESIGRLGGDVTLNGEPLSGIQARLVFTSEDDEVTEVTTESDGGFFVDLRAGAYRVDVFGVQEATCPGATVAIRSTGQREQLDCKRLAGSHSLTSTPRSNTCAVEDEEFTEPFEVTTRVSGGTTEVDMQAEGAPMHSGTYTEPERSVEVATPWIPLGNDVEGKEALSLSVYGVWTLPVISWRGHGRSHSGLRAPDRRVRWSPTSRW
ncbi:MAG: hypothetical protein HKN73_09820 [Gemmatimonadetes bacterium]|nr:hypothetical protein [Gemmatimonadota bacterium]